MSEQMMERKPSAYDGLWWDYSVETVPAKRGPDGLLIRAETYQSSVLTHEGQQLGVSRPVGTPGLAMRVAWEHFENAWSVKGKLLPGTARPSFRVSWPALPKV